MMMNIPQKDNFVWQLLERAFNAVILFVTGVLIARLVGPSEYGLVALTTVFVTFTDLVVNGGLGVAIVQKKNLTDEDFSVVFSINTIIAAVAVFLFILIAPYIAAYYEESKIANMMYLYAVGIWPFAVCGILRSKLMRMFDFRAMFLASGISLAIAATVGVFLAYKGAGVYAMMVQTVLGSVLCMIILWIYTGRNLSLTREISKGKSFINYGYKMMLSNMLDTSFKSFPTIVVPKVYGQEVLSFFTYGRQIPNVLITTIYSAVVTFAFPIFAKNQHDLGIIKRELRFFIKNYLALVMPIVACLVACSEEIILFLLGEQWLEAEFFLCVFSLVYVVYPLQMLGFQAIAAIGNSDVFLKYEIYRKIIGAAMLFYSIYYDIHVFMYMQVVTAIIFLIMNIHPSRVYLRYGIVEQAVDVLPDILVMIAVFFLVRSVYDFGDNLVLIALITKCLICIGIYFVFYYFFRRKELYYWRDKCKAIIMRI